MVGRGGAVVVFRLRTEALSMVGCVRDEELVGFGIGYNRVEGSGFGSWVGSWILGMGI